MTSEKQLTGLSWWAVVATMVALSAFGTMLIRIPIPATTGYFNLGDVFVVWAGLWLGPVGGALVGALGPTLADAVGFPQFILATMVTKGVEGGVVGLLSLGRASVARRTLAALAGGAIVVVGYFFFEAYIYPALGQRIPFFAVTDWAAAIVEIVPNTIQGIIGAAGGLALWRATSGTTLLTASDASEP